MIISKSCDFLFSDQPIDFLHRKILPKRF